MSVLCINIIAHMDIDARICLVRTGNKNYFLKGIFLFISSRIDVSAKEIVEQDIKLILSLKRV